jgi:DNA-directed RNA polymerase subunit beta'
VTEVDCGTEKGLLMTPIIEGGDVVEPLRERILGRVVAKDVMTSPARRDRLTRPAPARRALGPASRSGYRPGRGALHRSPARRATASVPVLRSRSGPWPSRQHRRGGRRHRRAVHRRAGHAADHAYLPHRWCGVAGRGAVSNVQVKATTVRCAAQHQDRAAPQRQPGCRVALRRADVSDEGPARRSATRSPTAPPARWRRRSGRGRRRSSPPGTRTPTRSSPRWRVRCASRTSRRRHVQSKTDELTGLASIEVMDPGQRPAAGKDLRPRSSLLVDDNGEELKPGRHRTAGAYYFRPGPSSASRRRQGGVGDILCPYPAGVSKTRDITGGLPRVADCSRRASRRSRRCSRRPPAPSASARRPRASAPGDHADGRRRDRMVRTTTIPKVAQRQRVRGRAVERAR